MFAGEISFPQWSAGADFWVQEDHASWLSPSAMPMKPDMTFPESRGDVTLDPFQLEALRPLLLEQEMRIKGHFDHRMEQLARLLDHDKRSESKAQRGPFQNPKSDQGLLSPDEQGLKAGLKAGVAPHLIQLIDRVKADSEKRIFDAQKSLASAADFVSAAGQWNRALERGIGMYEYAVDFLVILYAFSLGVQIQHTSTTRSEPAWALTLEIAFCVIFSLDLLIRICMERKRFFTGWPFENLHMQRFCEHP